MRVLFYVCILVFAIALANSALAQEFGELTGKIVDADTKEQLPGIRIEIIGTSLNSMSDVHGFFRISNVPQGTYAVQATMFCYQPATIEKVSVLENKASTIKIKMKLKKSFIMKKEKQPLRIKDHGQTQTIHIIPAKEIEHTPKK